MEFEWHPEKAESNIAKHAVTFEEASTVFGDWFYITFADPQHSDTEERFISIGMSDQNRLLLISHTDRNGRIRIISAREAKKRERNYYEEHGDRP